MTVIDDPARAEARAALFVRIYEKKFIAGPRQDGGSSLTGPSTLVSGTQDPYASAAGRNRFATFVAAL